MVDLSRYAARIESARKEAIAYYDDPRSSFVHELQSVGFVLDRPLELKRLVRIKAPADKGQKRSGWYVYHEVADSNDPSRAIGIGAYGAWNGIEKITWVSKPSRSMTSEESRAYYVAIEQQRQQTEAEIAARQSEAAEFAKQVILSAASAVDHPYLTRKQVKAVDGLKVTPNGRLAVPVYSPEGEIVSLQLIDESGDKKFLIGGRTKSCFFPIPGQSAIIICEGVATGLSLHQATGYTIYCAFSTNNLYDVASYAKASHPGEMVIIAGDDDVNTDGNPGKTKATQVAEGLSLPVYFPSIPTDFNDQHTHSGIESVAAVFNSKSLSYVKSQAEAFKTVHPTTGFLGSVFDYYNTTSGNEQRGFAAQTALATASVLLARRFKTNTENYASLFLLNIAKSGTGKEHAKSIIERILDAAGCGHLVNGDGYTAGSAVLSALLLQPRHITVIDEMGRYLEVAGNNSRTNSHVREANTKLMEAIGRCGSVMRPQAYSTMLMKKEQAEELRSRIVWNPAITLLGITTPSTFFASLNRDAIKDGFINRFIISISNAERAVRDHKPMIEVPQSIIDWIMHINQRAAHISEDNVTKVDAITLTFTEAAYELQHDFQLHCIDLANKLEPHGMEELPSRANEMAMRIALIHALSENPATNSIAESSMKWAIAYVRSCLESTIAALKMNISASEHESDKKKILQALRDASPLWVKRSDMRKKPPYSAFKAKDLQEILDALMEAELIEQRPTDKSKGGRPSVEYCAIQ